MAKADKSFSLKERGRSFVYAFRGLATLLRTQHNARIHAAAALLALAMGLFFHIRLIEWAAVLLCIAAVLITEALNTAIEFLADEVSLERRERLGAAKDLAAAAVLVASLASALCGAFIFIPRLLLFLP